MDSYGYFWYLPYMPFVSVCLGYPMYFLLGVAQIQCRCFSDKSFTLFKWNKGYLIIQLCCQRIV